jgi:hypothetical protein
MQKILRLRLRLRVVWLLLRLLGLMMLEHAKMMVVRHRELA